MTQTGRPLIGSVVERKPGSSTASSPKFGGSASGFPVVEHRSKSAFARGRDQSKRRGADNRQKHVPVVQTSGSDAVQSLERESVDASGTNRPVTSVANERDWMRQVSEENDRKVMDMSEEAREQERKEILERFGSGVGDVLRRAREARERKEREVREETQVDKSGSQSTPIDSRSGTSSVHDTGGETVANRDMKIDTTAHLENDTTPSATPLSPRPALSGSSTRPSSRADRRLRFAEVTPQDVHVYQSAPPSPKKKPLALLPPTDSDRADGSVVQLGQWKGNDRTTPSDLNPMSGVVSTNDVLSPLETEPPEVMMDTNEDLEEGTPEYIRRRFFPNLPARDPSLAWIESSPPPSDPSASSSLRFDLTGTPIPSTLSTTLPTHLGLHHHAEGVHAGYTLDDIFLLSRSSVPAQRATMLDVLSRIVRKLGKLRKGDNVDAGIGELRGQEEKLRKRIIAAGVEAIGQHGSVGAMAVEVLWECIVGWDEQLAEIEGVELKEVRRTASTTESAESDDSTGSDPISSLPLGYLIPQIIDAIRTAALPPTSLTQLLSVLHRLAQHSNRYAKAILTTPNLITSVISTFLLTPIPPSPTSPPPNPAAIQFLSTLALGSRSNASALVEPADVLLRFIVTLPPASPYSQPLALSLLTYTLEFYTVLASCGFYAHVAGTAAEYFARLSAYILSEECRSKRLMCAWAGLLEAWMICATDPHKTSPSHDILWSQVVGWGWGAEVLALRSKLGEEEEYGEIWTAVWKAEAAWLEGARINGVKGGAAERMKALELIADGFEDGAEETIVWESIERLKLALKAVSPFESSHSDSIRISHLREISKHANVLTSALRLWLSCTDRSSDSPLPSPPFPLPFPLFSSVAAIIINHPLWSYLTSHKLDSPPPYIALFLRPLSSYLSYFLRFSRKLPSTTPVLWLAQAFTILSRLLPGDEDFAQPTIEEAMSLITPAFATQVGWEVQSLIWERGGMGIITPFYTYCVRPEAEEIYGYIGPLYASPQSISLSTTQRIPSTSSLRSRQGRDFGLPIPKDWPFTPLDHLLRSGSSPIFKALPFSWNASETELTRSVLLLAKIVWEVLRMNGLGSEITMSREEVVFGCMKVFMLEHGQDQESGVLEEEVFRDAIVGNLMGELLAPFTWRASASSSPPSSQDATLEQVSVRFLGSSTPFFQFYTDFLTLYDSVSFSDPLFARLLLPPISMRYPVDYRKLLWHDFSHVLRTVRTPVEQLIAGDLGEYLYPLETDTQVIGAYLRALIKTSFLEGFLRFVAIHHVAGNIWKDLSAVKNASDAEGSEKLLKAVVNQASLEVVRDVVLYKQASGEEGRELLLPPECFGQSGEWKEERLQSVEAWGLRERLQGLLMS